MIAIAPSLKRGVATVERSVEELRFSNPVLFYLGVANLVGFALTFVLPVVDSRELDGISIWIKPSKFFLSFAIYALTIGWILRSVCSLRRGFVMKVSWFIALTVTLVMACVLYQGAHGERSHFNRTPLGRDLYAIMGMCAYAQVAAVSMILFRFAKDFSRVSDQYILGIEWGLFVFVVGCAVGFTMMIRAGHTVGANDGGIGLAYLNWSREHGDLRIAHFFTLHALQLLPLLGIYFAHKKIPKFMVHLIGGLYFTFCIAVFFQALKGLAFI